jgi:hypothetical protein
MEGCNQTKKVALILFFIAILLSAVKGQTYFKEISILSDTVRYSYAHNTIRYLNGDYFFFKIRKVQQVFEITFYPQKDKNITSAQLIPSSDIMVIDSLINIDNTYFKGKIKFKDLSVQNPKTLLIAIDAGNEKRTEEVNFFPYYETELLQMDKPVDIYAGEEKIIEIPSKNPDNIKIPSGIIKTADYDYSIGIRNNILEIQIHPYTIGNKELTLNLKTLTPFLNSSNQLSYDLVPYVLHFTVRPSRLNFLNTDKSEFFFDAKADESEEMQLDQKKGLEPGKMYRIENQLDVGGKLIAELYAKSVVGDNKILCSLHPYSYHTINEGYLYIKQGNETKSITNFNILQKPIIDGIWLLHEGEEWSMQPFVRPGEEVQMRIEGKGLAKTKFKFANCTNVKQDSTRIFDDVIFYSFTVPIGITNKAIYVEMNQKRTKYELTVKENRKPRDLDFVLINYGPQTIPFTSPIANKPIVDPHPLNDINISFDRTLIDQKEDLYGKQYLDFEFKIYNNKNDLIEDQKLENIVICPDETSVRGDFYDKKDCFKSVINVNDHLLHKTYDLEGWSKIEVIIKHAEKNYSEPGYSRRVIIIKQKLTSIDLQASFPAGLLINNYRSKGIGELSGLSIAFLAQMSFYDRNAIEKVKPFKIGAGFMALNIFNLESTNAQPDIAAVIIGSIYPLKPERKFNFPLYFGGGYMLRSGNWFTLLGPGVQFNF